MFVFNSLYSYFTAMYYIIIIENLSIKQKEIYTNKDTKKLKAKKNNVHVSFKCDNLVTRVHRYECVRSPKSTQIQTFPLTKHDSIALFSNPSPPIYTMFYNSRSTRTIRYTRYNLKKKRAICPNIPTTNLRIRSYSPNFIVYL